MLFILIVMSFLPFPCLSIFDIPGMTPGESYVIEGDVNVGVIMRVRYAPEEGAQQCGDISPYSLQKMEIFADTIREVNSNVNILPNVTMGLTILDDCAKNRWGQARALQFLSPSDGVCQWSDVDGANATSSAAAEAVVDGFPPYRTHAVISSSNSGETVLIANILNTFRMPVLTVMATSEELNDEYRFPYFTRTIPSDMYQATAIVDLMTKFSWSYVTVISSLGPYGESGGQAVVKLTEERGICVAYAVTLHPSYGDDFYEKVANRIISDEKSNVIVLFAHSSYAQPLLKKLNESIPAGRSLIFLCTDAVSYSLFDSYSNYALGAYFIDLYGKMIEPSFYENWDSIGPYSFRNEETVYYRNKFEQVYNCSTRNETNTRKCNESLKMADILDYKSQWANLYREPVLKIIEATQLYYENNCPEVFAGGYSKEYVQECIERESLFPYIKSVITLSTRKYHVLQLQEIANSSEPDTIYVGTWEMELMGLNINNSMLKWNFGKQHPPESICAYPCKNRQFKIQLELKCCWECRYCGSNEIVVRNGSNCETCPQFYWPDQETATYCYAIEYTHYTWDSTTTIGIAFVSGCGTLLSIGTLVYFLMNRKTKLIKATGLSLSLVTLLGVFMSFPSALLMVAPPNPLICAVSSVGMHLGFCITYSSLLMKTNRIFRVFQAAKHSAKMPKYIRNSAILIFTTILVMLQIFILTVTMFMSPLKTSLRQPVATEEFVELMCDLPLKTFIPPLGFNMILIIFCSIYAIKTRKLPDNFNESKLIFLLVLATGFLWMAFLPTYFAAEDSKQKAGLLAMLLLISGTLTILCLFAPKIYATIYVDELELHTNKIGTSFTAGPSSMTVSTT